MARRDAPDPLAVERRGLPSRPQGSRAGPADGVERDRRRGGRIHGRRPLTDLAALLPLIAPLVSGHSDLAIGSRLAPGASVARAPRREVISRTYNLILRTVLATRVRDAQCGFKAVRADVAHRLLPAVEDDAWFFDTELLLLAEHNGLRIHEVPVD